MIKEELFARLMAAAKLADAKEAFKTFINANSSTISEQPIGARPNNRGTIEVASDPGRSVVERITNAIDAQLELEHLTHAGKPTCASPKEAAEAWLGVDTKGLGAMTQKARQDLARLTTVRLEPGEGKESRIVHVKDSGIGLLPEEMPSSILSLNEGNKWQKHYLAGTFGQGGSSTFAFSEITLIASRRYDSGVIGFTVVWYKDLPATEFKSGHYVYLTEKGLPLKIDAIDGNPLGACGTIVRHFGYDLSSYPSPFGVRSLYGAMNRMLFDPVAPIWFENKVENWNRGIYGSRNRLNSGSEDAEGGNPLALAHQMPAFSVSLGENGQMGLEYWVLNEPEKSNMVPIAAYVDPRKPIVMTINGQNQSELSVTLVRKDAEFPYLRTRLICHVDCDGLSPLAKRALFASTREQAKEGYLLNRIRGELVAALRSDDELVRLNREAKERSLSAKDDEAKRRLQRDVARMLNLRGKLPISSRSRAQIGVGSGNGGGGGGRKVVEPLDLHEPPTYVRIVQEQGTPFKFHAGQRKWIRIETDASSDYHEPTKPESSRVNFVVGNHLVVAGTTALRGGRMRVAVECGTEVAVGLNGTIRVELHRMGLTSLSDEVSYEVVPPPEPKEKKSTTTFPDFEVVRVEGPEDPNWQEISDDDANVGRHASRATLDEGTLYIYYSAAFPKFDIEFNRWATKDAQSAESFQRRYEVWLAVHSLLMHEEASAAEGNPDEPNEEVSEDFLRKERCRFAVVAAMMASQEIQTGESVAGVLDEP